MLAVFRLNIYFIVIRYYRLGLYDVETKVLVKSTEKDYDL